MNLEAKRLILRKPKKEDWKEIIEGLGDYEVSKNIASTPYPYTKKIAIKRIEKSLQKFKKKENYPFMIILKKEKKLIGSLGIFNIDENSKTAEMGSWINKNYWKKGYITEAKILVLDFAFNKLKLRKITSYTFADNKASNKTQKSLGYKLEGTLRKAEKCNATGKIHNSNVYGLLKEEWKKVRPKVIKRLDRKLK